MRGVWWEVCGTWEVCGERCVVGGTCAVRGRCAVGGVQYVGGVWREVCSGRLVSKHPLCNIHTYRSRCTGHLVLIWALPILNIWMAR